ncbi:MAG: helix-turn-helix domain-containing protein [Saprospirales bacterium]|nr:helix-turn-helix domain-containing protein [Saprospirales bacterium]MBK8492085.1 helix-turn-helix domain-containing protein [Saprospirales bacterium]
MNVYREITPLKGSDVFVVLDSVSNGFDYPIHNHPEYEINLVIGMSGTRIVGDSTERYTDADLVLLGPYIYHKWDGDAHLQERGQPYRVITIQFAMDLFSGQFFQKERFLRVQQFLRESTRGIQFYGKTFEQAMPILINLTEDRGFTNIIEFLQLLELLSQSTESTFLASAGFSTDTPRSKSNRIQVAYSYILKHFADPELRIGDVAAQVNMSASAFSHFFQKYAFQCFTQFLIDVRIGHACKLLLDTDEPIKTISYNSGFNNLGNFNRLFKKYRFCTPVEYRQRYFQKTDFDWTKQVTPWQFLPGKSKPNAIIKPRDYSTRLLHL